MDWLGGYRVVIGGYGCAFNSIVTTKVIARLVEEFAVVICSPLDDALVGEALPVFG